MHYAKIYNDITSRAISRKKLKRTQEGYVYYEKHHIVPRCLGGLDAKDNIVLLTAEEHWLVHLLLVKMHPGNSKLIYACQAMSMSGGYNKRTTNKLFGWIRREYCEAMSIQRKGNVVSQEQKDKISATLKGRSAPHQLGANNVAKRPEVAKKISLARTGQKLGPKSEETKKRISAANKGHKGANKEANGSFDGYIIATPKNGGEEIRMAGGKEIRSLGFTYDSVRKCVRGKNKSHKGYIFRKE